ncbi:iron uptake system protein EfeO [Streptosporangium saharense]|uniref:Iron uptake system EfeUOB component EfeO/EfeM n=1 Tax=Streptosporangium saharense TaxID=1706840 RepID=A0A7W7QRF0_9ACTN|nr:iron uptake system protein EfeO [Streptosporangium saharense]MBB4918400.1 iron uptake system EfeUOB component EfeO/EfeM [Streptosporangium saharense]
MSVVLRPAAACGLLALALALTACGSATTGAGAPEGPAPAVPAAAPPGGYAAQEALESARVVGEYRTYAERQIYDAIAKTAKFVDAIKKGDVKRAKALYGPSRLGWESVEPVVEAFPEIDVRVDSREADLGQGEEWTGWHRLEKALWRAPETLAREAAYGDALLVDLSRLRAMLPKAEITVASMATGAKELLDEVAVGKVTGEEEAFSHTDLWDFKGNVDGAHEVYRLLRPMVVRRDARLTATLDTEFADMRALLARHARGEGFVAYTDLSKEQVKELSDGLNALAEPLARLAAVISG